MPRLRSSLPQRRRICSVQFTQLGSNRPPSWYFPDCSKVFAAQDRTHYPRLLLHNEPAVLRLPQMPQLRGMLACG